MNNWKHTHDRKIMGSLVALTKARTGNIPMKVFCSQMDELEAIISSTQYLRNAPFKYPSVNVRLGLKYEAKPDFLGINKTYGDLGMGIEVDVNDIQVYDEENLRRIFRIVILRCLITAGKKYDRPVEEFENMLATLNQSEWVAADRDI